MAMEGMPQREPGLEPHVELEHVRMAFDARKVFDDLSCRFPRNKISVILGGSGSGKSTVLRLIGGLVRPQAGRIIVAGTDIRQLSEREMYDVREHLGMMFQGGALLDSMMVFDNIAFPLREHTDMSEEQIAHEVHDRLQAVGLTNVDNLLPGQLSGGMVKRAALARAIIMNPNVVLCDEPFSGLDPISARRIECLLVDINTRRSITIIAVSHHIASTMRMADHVALLLSGQAIEGPPAALHDHADARVRGFFDENAEVGEDDRDEEAVAGPSKSWKPRW